MRAIYFAFVCGAYEISMRVLGCQYPLSEGGTASNASSSSSENGDRSSESNASKTSTSVSRLSSYSNGVLSTFLDP